MSQARSRTEKQQRDPSYGKLFSKIPKMLPDDPRWPVLANASVAVVFLFLASFQPLIWVSIATIATALGKSMRTVRKAVRTLEKSRLILRVGKHATYGTNLYQINWRYVPLPEDDDRPRQKPAPSQRDPSCSRQGPATRTGNSRSPTPEANFRQLRTRNKGNHENVDLSDQDAEPPPAPPPPSGGAAARRLASSSKDRDSKESDSFDRAASIDLEHCGKTVLPESLAADVELLTRQRLRADAEKEFEMLVRIVSDHGPIDAEKQLVGMLHASVLNNVTDQGFGDPAIRLVDDSAEHRYLRSRFIEAWIAARLEKD